MNYGITFCKKVLSSLKKQEDEMFEKHGHGFDRLSQAYLTERKITVLLNKFKEEKKCGSRPSYDPDIHGSL